MYGKDGRKECGWCYKKRQDQHQEENRRKLYHIRSKIKGKREASQQGTKRMINGQELLEVGKAKSGWMT